MMLPFTRTRTSLNWLAPLPFFLVCLSIDVQVNVLQEVITVTHEHVVSELHQCRIAIVLLKMGM